MVVATDDGGIDIAELIDLCTAHKTHVHVAALEIVCKNIVHADYRERSAYESRVANGKRQACRFSTDDNSFVNHHQVRCVRSLGEVACQIGLTDSDEHDITVTQQTRGVDDHQLSRRIFDFAHNTSYFLHSHRGLALIEQT